MPREYPSEPLSAELLTSRFDGAHLVRVDHDARLIAVWNGSQTINLYHFDLREVADAMHTVPADDDGVPVSREEIEEHIEDLFEEYRDW